MSQPEQVVSITSIYGAHTQRGLVEVHIGTFKRQWDAAEARRIGYMLLEAAEAADSDTLVLRWLTERMGMKDMQQKAVVLADFRKLRSEMPSVLAETWNEPPPEPNGA